MKRIVYEFGTSDTCLEICSLQILGMRFQKTVEILTVTLNHFWVVNNFDILMQTVHTPQKTVRIQKVLLTFLGGPWASFKSVVL